MGEFPGDWCWLLFHSEERGTKELIRSSYCKSKASQSTDESQLKMTDVISFGQGRANVMGDLFCGAGPGLG